jgi:hypothetical protein
LTSELLTWRRTLEGRFAFNPREPLNPADISTLRGALAKRKVEAENRLRGAVLNLQNTAAYARDLRSSLSRSAQHAFTQLEQAKLDERKGAGHFYKPVKAIVLFARWSGYSLRECYRKNLRRANRKRLRSRTSRPPVRKGSRRLHRPLVRRTFLQISLPRLLKGCCQQHLNQRSPRHGYQSQRSPEILPRSQIMVSGLRAAWRPAHSGSRPTST